MVLGKQASDKNSWKNTLIVFESTWTKNIRHHPRISNFDCKSPFWAFWPIFTSWLGIQWILLKREFKTSLNLTWNYSGLYSIQFLFNLECVVSDKSVRSVGVDNRSSTPGSWVRYTVQPRLRSGLFIKYLKDSAGVYQSTKIGCRGYLPVNIHLDLPHHSYN